MAISVANSSPSFPNSVAQSGTGTANINVSGSGNSVSATTTTGPAVATPAVATPAVPFQTDAFVAAPQQGPVALDCCCPPPAAVATAPATTVSTAPAATAAAAPTAVAQAPQQGATAVAGQPGMPGMMGPHRRHHHGMMKQLMQFLKQHPDIMQKLLGAMQQQQQAGVAGAMPTAAAPTAIAHA